MMTMHDLDTLTKLSDTRLVVGGDDDDIRGRTVKDRDGKELGHVDDLLIDQPLRKVRFMLVESGGFAGLGTTKVLIPIDAITAITDIDVRINQTHQHVARAPRYDPALVTNRTYHSDLYDHYGHAPYWGSGYSYPSYPFYPS
jgi:sporulation protein YlmC with PRC-barrel domain